MTLPPTILCRLSFLPDDALQALRAASILGSGFMVTGLSVTMARPALGAVPGAGRGDHGAGPG
jgi:hypothetical protein